MKKNEKKFPGEKKDIILIIGIFLLVLFIASNLSLTGEVTWRKTTSTITTTDINKISNILNKGVKNIPIKNIPIRYAKIAEATDYKEDIVMISMKKEMILLLLLIVMSSCTNLPFVPSKQSITIPQTHQGTIGI